MISLKPQNNPIKYTDMWLSARLADMWSNINGYIEKFEFDETTKQLTLYTSEGEIHRIFMQQIN